MQLCPVAQARLLAAEQERVEVSKTHEWPKDAATQPIVSGPETIVCKWRIQVASQNGENKAETSEESSLNSNVIIILESDAVLNIYYKIYLY